MKPSDVAKTRNASRNLIFDIKSNEANVVKSDINSKTVSDRPKAGTPQQNDSHED